MFNKDLLDILYNPKESQNFKICDEKILDEINNELLTDYSCGLVSSDNTMFYPVEDGIPIMTFPIPLYTKNLPKVNKVDGDVCEMFKNLWENREKKSFFKDNGFISEKCTKEAICQLGDLNKKRVLIIGAGRGYEANAFLKTGALVINSDIALEGLRYNKSGELQRVVVNAENLYFKPESFDVVLGNTMLMYVNKKVVFEEVYRVLKHDGRYVIIEPTFSSLFFQFTTIVTLLARRLSNKRFHYIEKYKRHNYFVKNDLKELRRNFCGLVYHNSIAVTPIFHLLRKIGYQKLVNGYFSYEKILVDKLPKLKEQGIMSIYIFKK